MSHGIHRAIGPLHPSRPSRPVVPLSRLTRPLDGPVLDLAPVASLAARHRRASCGTAVNRDLGREGARCRLPWPPPSLSRDAGVLTSDESSSPVEAFPAVRVTELRASLACS